MKFVTGALQDKEDKRDYLIGDYLLTTEKLPQKIDWSGEMLPVRLQGDEPTCVAFAAAAIKESEEHEGQLSPRFLYDRIAQPGGGAYSRDVMKVLLCTGVCPEWCQPYFPNLNRNPCPQAVDLARPNRIRGYARLTTIDEMRRCLYETGSFMISFMISDSWTNPKNGIVTAEGLTLGGHAVACCGYDDDKQLLVFKNSWGTEWGLNGFGFISYSDCKKILIDAWSFIDIPENDERQPTKSWWQKLRDYIRGLFS